MSMIQNPPKIPLPKGWVVHAAIVQITHSESR